jgi:hypothetical protein
VAGLSAFGGTAGAWPKASGRRPPSPPGRAFHTALEVGRLVEVRLVGVCSADEIATVSFELRQTARRLTQPAILFCDYRAAPPFSQEVGDLWSRNMRGFNAQVGCSGILLSPDNETFNLQFARVVRCAGLSSRRCFEDPGELRAWLGEHLTEEERSRLERLLLAP